MSALGVALVDELDGEALEALITRLPDSALDVLAERLASRMPAAAPDGWLTTKQAADYLGLSEKALYHRTAEGSIPCHRDSEEKGAKLWFRRSELDRWRRGE